MSHSGQDIVLNRVKIRTESKLYPIDVINISIKILTQIQVMLIAVSVILAVTCLCVQFNVLTLALPFSKPKVKTSGKNPLQPCKKQDLIYT